MKKILNGFLAIAMVLFSLSPAFADTTSYTGLTTAQEDQLNEIGASSAISSSRGVQLGTLLAELIDENTRGLVLSVNEGAVDDAFEQTMAIIEPTADRTATFPDASGTVPLAQASYSANKIFVASDAVASGQTSKTTTVTGITSAAKCVVTGQETSTNAAYFRSAIAGSNQVVVTVNTDPGASNFDYNLVCFE